MRQRTLNGGRVKSKLIRVQLFEGETRPCTDDTFRSRWLRSLIYFPETKIYVPAGDELEKRERIPDPFPDVQVGPGGRLEVELGLVLHDLLPNLDGYSEYMIDVASDFRPSERLAVSNQMLTGYTKRHGEPYIFTVPRGFIPNPKSGPAAPSPEVGTTPLRTCVSWTTTVTGKTAGAALRRQLFQRVDALVEMINRLIAAVLQATNQPYLMRTPRYGRFSFDVLYLVMRSTCGEIKCDRVGLGASRVYRNAGDLADEAAAALRSTALQLESCGGGHVRFNARKGETPLPALLLVRQAWSHYGAGVVDLALLLSVVAAEAATSAFLQRRWSERGVSREAYADRKPTYENQLDILIPAELSGDPVINERLLEPLRKARSLRNAFMHRAVPIRSSSEVHEICRATDVYVTRLQELSSS